MRKSFKLVRSAAVEAAETLGMVLDEPFSVSSEGYEFERYSFHFRGGGGVKFELSISGDDIDQFFYGAP